MPEHSRRQRSLGRLVKVTGRRVRIAAGSPARFLTDEDRQVIEAEIHDAAKVSNAYAILLFSACGIAALGLLQSSVAVVIGAMLISPLMGPIMSMGLALARLEPREFRRAAVTLAVGASLSVLSAVLIVWAVPLKDVTPEILARTRPTLLDLVVALLSGFVGAYLTINRKGAAIAGVAIATALMPPLAVVGYGLATQAWNVAGGATLLFLTNVVAILGAVFGVARRYGFRPAARTGSAWEVPALIGVTAVLCVPLALSLQAIVVEARERTRVRSAIERTFEGTNAHITDLEIQIRDGDPYAVQSVVVTRRYVRGAAQRVAEYVGEGVRVSLEQVVTADGLPRPDPLGGAVGRAQMLAAYGAASPQDRLRGMLSGLARVEAIERDGEALVATLVLEADGELADYRALEQAAQRLLPQTPIRVQPPLLPLPDVPFPRGSSRLDGDGQAAVDTIVWALARWNRPAVTIEGRASPHPRRGRRPADVRMAQSRAEAVAEQLGGAGIEVVETTAGVPERLAGPEAGYLLARVDLAPARRPAEAVQPALAK